ncbi:MAG: hypothetical protein H7258_15400 [Ferruginibacter sp.]|nr:hypothetical protein [Ferruginibacter sp.]
MKNLLTISVLCILFSGCKKNDTTPTVYVSGHLYQTCGGLAVKNQALYIYQLNAGSNSTGTLATGSTDSTGYFKIPYGTTNPINLIELRLGGGNYAVCTWPFYSRDIDDLNVYNISTCNIVVRLNVINPYTSLDTLDINDYRNLTNLKIPGPFTPGILYTANNYQILLPSYLSNSETGILEEPFAYRINHAPTFTIQPFRLKTCGTNEVVINIE